MSDTEQHRRKDDTLYGKVLRLAPLITSIGVILGAIVFLGNIQWQTKDDAACMKQEAIARDEKLQGQITETDKTTAVILNKLENMDKTLARIEKKM